ncbi:hypothetical protein X943_001590 [Babesia divergens]|uniref:PIG-P domain-containing protein n=1 Tax=Babesia divergens TaxID=32595 RepID=A0AAD9G6U7_BABDI|nr:hypothetical protein X943_001590 [Babesia divergens]
MNLEIKAYLTLILCHVFLGKASIRMIYHNAALYFVWSFLPYRIIQAYGITYYPSTHWAVSLPSAILFISFCIAFYNWFTERSMLPPLNSVASFTDPMGKRSYDIHIKHNLEFYDVPLEGVNRRLYS